MRLFHRTTAEAAEAIVTGGFRDGHGSYFFGTLTLSGVFLATTPADINEGAKGDHVLEVTLPDNLDMTAWEIETPGMPIWEYIVPAEVINSRGTVRLLTEDEVDLAAEAG